MAEPVVLLVDNGSRRAAATLGLRRIAAALGEASGYPVSPVSLQHADQVAADELDGVAASVFPQFMREQLREGRREFVVVPLFFGPSRALSGFIPQQLEQLEKTFGAVDLRIADVLVPLPRGEPRLADILADHAVHAGVSLDVGDDHVIVVDHGSPLPQVNAVRRYAVEALRQRLPKHIVIEQVAMERRDGADYQFNGELLGELLDRIAGERHAVSAAIAMLFLLPGRHAGPGGDIADICEAAMARHPGLEVAISPLIGEHPKLIEILHDRLRGALMR